MTVMLPGCYRSVTGVLPECGRRSGTAVLSQVLPVSSMHHQGVTAGSVTADCDRDVSLRRVSTVPAVEQKPRYAEALRQLSSDRRETNQGAALALTLTGTLQ